MLIWAIVLALLASGGRGGGTKSGLSGEGLPSLLGGVLKGDTLFSALSVGSGVSLLVSCCWGGLGLKGIFGFSARLTVGGMEEVRDGNCDEVLELATLSEGSSDSTP